MFAPVKRLAGKIISELSRNVSSAVLKTLLRSTQSLHKLTESPVVAQDAVM